MKNMNMLFIYLSISLPIYGSENIKPRDDIQSSKRRSRIIQSTGLVLTGVGVGVALTASSPAVVAAGASAAGIAAAGTGLGIAQELLANQISNFDAERDRQVKANSIEQDQKQSLPEATELAPLLDQTEQCTMASRKSSSSSDSSVDSNAAYFWNQFSESRRSRSYSEGERMLMASIKRSNLKEVERLIHEGLDLLLLLKVTNLLYGKQLVFLLPHNKRDGVMQKK